MQVVRTIRRRSLLVIAMVLWLSFALVAAAIGFSQDGWWQVPFLLGGATAALAFWRGQPWRDRWSQYLSFAAVFVLACVGNHLLYLADFFVSGERFNGWPVYVESPEWAVVKGEVISLIGSLLTVAAWFAVGGGKYTPAMMVSGDNSSRWKSATLVIYLISLFVLFLTQANPVVAAEFGQLLPTLLAVGSTCAFFLPSATVHSKGKRILSVFLLSLPFLYTALLQGMKEQIIFALLPTLYLIWILTRRPVWKGALVACAVILAGVITSYVSYFRAEVWWGNRTLSQVQAVTEFAEQVEFDGVSRTTSEGLRDFLLRSNSTIHRGWTVALADVGGYDPGLVFGPLAYVFIPRIVWPEKPEIRQGWEFSGKVFGDSYMDISTSSTSAGFYTSLYLGYGWLAVVVGALSMGALMAALLRLAERLGGELLVGLFSFTMIPFALRLDETWSVGALTGPVIGFTYLYLIFLLATLVTPALTKNRIAGSPMRS